MVRRNYLADRISAYYGVKRDVLFCVDTRNNKLSLNTINHHYDLVGSILTAAIDDELIEKNPQPKAPKVTKPKRSTYNDEEQIRALLKAFDDEPIMYRAMGYLFLDTGIRSSELTGLKWECVDFENNTVFIMEQRQHVQRYGEIIKDPKTESGTRLVSVAPTVMAILRQLRVHQWENRLKMGSAWVENDYVFKHFDGKPIFAKRPYQWLTALLKKHGLSKLTVPGLRHPYVKPTLKNKFLIIS
jgi:integrase